MADQASRPLADQSQKRSRQRSPNYPAVGLREAVERVRKLYEADKRAGAPLDAAVRHLGFSSAHGSAMVVVSALKKYGLVEDSDGRIVPTQRAVSILVYPESDPRRKTALRAAALGPSVYRDLFDRFREHGQIASDQTLSAELEAEMGFNRNAVSGFIKDFRDTLFYACLTAQDGVILSAEGEDRRQADDRQPPKVGDWVQWESQGTLQFADPKRVREVSEDGQWAFVEGSDTGLPINELTVKEAPAQNPLPDTRPRPRTMVEAQTMAGHQIKPPAIPRQDLFSLAEGLVSIQYPPSLSSESFEDLSAWLDILKRKIGRSVAKEEPTLHSVSFARKDQVDEPE